jgi:hypothetical protein
MEEINDELSDNQQVLKLGIMLGQRRAFGLVADRCSAAQAECLRQVRDEKTYLKFATKLRMRRELALDTRYHVGSCSIGTRTRTAASIRSRGNGCSSRHTVASGPGKGQMEEKRAAVRFKMGS